MKEQALTGAELLAQVRDNCIRGSNPDLRDDLDGCVLLTAEEAEKVRHALAHSSMRAEVRNMPYLGYVADEALALLTPAGKDETL